MNLKNIVLKKMLGKRKQTKKNHIISDSIYMKYLEKTDWQQHKDTWLLGGEDENGQCN